MLLIRQFIKLQFSIFVGISLTPLFLWGSACCGGAFAVPSLITGDDHALVTTSLSYSKIDTDVYANGIWQKRSGEDTTQLLKIEATQIFYDRFQSGISIPVQLRNKSGAQSGQSSGLGDVSAQMGYEYLTNWDYHPWRPKGIAFVSLTLPTGKSIYESEDELGLDSRGRGFWALGLGTVFTRSWVKWDVNSTFEVHRSFDKTAQNSQNNMTIKPGYGGSLSLGTGYNFKNARLGGALTWTQEDAIDIKGDNPSQGSQQRFATGTISGSYLFSSEWASTLSYSDQTLFGDPTNASLSKSVALFLQRRWLR